MNQFIKKIIASAVSVSIIASGVFVGTQIGVPAQADSAANSWNGKAPKYIFMFIGDGMTYPQLTSATEYLGATYGKETYTKPKNFEFMSFSGIGTATTFDSSSFCPDSASTATSISTGHKTLSGVINMDEQKKIAYETIAEKLKKQKGYKIGIVSSVPINHATPAAFYSHQPSRGNYYEIANELVNSNFDYFGGGDFLSPNGKKNDQKNILELAQNKGYTIAKDTKSIIALNKSSKKVIAINPTTIEGALPYEMDRAKDDLSLADFTRKGIDVLDNEKGFFMMVEGGKIDWACHANDAAASIHDTIAFNNAVNESIKFYKKHPQETLIIVTGDHETGGMSVGFAGTGYSTYLPQIAGQKMSYEAYNEQIDILRSKKATFEEVLTDVSKNFGLVTQEQATDKTPKTLILSNLELQNLKDAYTLSMIAPDQRKLTEKDGLLYGSYEPLSMTLTHLLNNKSGIGWTSYSHTGIPTAVFAQGIGASLFNGQYDNTDIYNKLHSLTSTK